MAKPRKRHEGDPGISEPSEMNPSGNGSGSYGDSPNPDRISSRAYELYLARGGGDGRADEDWLEAERELTTGGRTAERGDTGE
jgi:Protein of unknown function (DUF2934)